MKIIFYCFLLFIGCTSNINRTQREDVSIPEPPYIIFLEKEIDKINQTGLMEIGNTITYIPLETSDKSLLADLKGIIATNSQVTIYDRSSGIDRIHLFNISGHFIRQIGKQGVGPGEYSKFIWDYCFSKDEKLIYLLVNGHSCLEYNLEGKFLNSYKLDSVPTRILPLNDSIFVLYCINSSNHRSSGPTEQSLIISDLHNNLKKTYPNHFQKNNKQTVNNPGAPFYSYQEKIRFKEFGVDTLYTVTENELITYAIVSLGKKELPTDIPTSELIKIIEGEVQTDKYFVRWIVEDNDNLFLTLHDWRNNLYGYYNKRANIVKVIGDKGFHNNIDGGLPFFPKYVYNDSILVDYVNAFELREHVLNSNTTEMRRPYGRKFDDLLKLSNSLDDEDNPVLVFVKK